MDYKDNNISDLIPDYSNNRLDEQERAEFERILKEDQELQDEYNDFQEFQSLYREIDPTEPSPSDAIFNQITNEITAHQKVESQKVERKAAVQPNQLVEIIRDFWQQLRESLTVPWMLAVAQAAVIVLLLMPATEQNSQNTYETLSGTEMAITAEKTGINVVFQPNALESDIRSLLHTIEGSVSSGPSKEGRYVVSISGQKDLDKAVHILKQSEIVLFAEPTR